MAQIELYTTPYCPYCIAAKKLLQSKGASFTEIDLAVHSDRREEMVARAHGRVTVPQIFIDATHVGGFDELYELDQAGRLDPLLEHSRQQS
jgi:glutaredoxin 3